MPAEIVTELRDAPPALCEQPSVERAPLRTLLLFSAPVAGQGFMLMLISLYLMKYSTDVLGVAPSR